MRKLIAIDARWDEETSAWIATSRDLPGLVVEAPSWSAMIAETEHLVPELLELAGAQADEVSLTFRAETRRDLARAS
ncbi:MAG: DUF1902 domain-containing protein [Methylobacteriaceae bacterium]|nr:DUF1902 domain-containing protein [Methylobacteriaceae bacterium]